MDFKNIIRKGNGGNDLKKIFSKFGSGWMRHQQVVFIVLVFISVGIGAFYWYESLHQAGWTEEKKKEYLATQSREINLKEADFKKVIAEIENRKKILESTGRQVKNIFEPY
jgi:hypothetical protein